MDEMTALQALEGVKKALADHLVRQLDNSNFTKEKALELLECDTELQVIAKALTPPTSEEVCEELERYFYQCVGKANPYIKYIKDLKQFVYVDGDKYYEVVVLDKHGYIAFQTTFPHYLVVLIGRFYGGLK